MNVYTSKWTKKHARFIGRVIFANFLELPLEKYKNIIEETEQSVYCKYGSNEVIERTLSKAKTTSNIKHASSKVIVEVAKNKKGFSIRYTHGGFNKTYIIHNNSCFTGLDSHLFYKLRRISSRNELTHRIIEMVIEYQRRYLNTGNPIDLVPLSQIQLAKLLSARYSGSRVSKTSSEGLLAASIDISWVSRSVNKLSVITPSGEERLLKWFFITRKHINKIFIKQLLDKENENIEPGKLKKPLTDSHIRAKLESEYGVKLSRQSISLCRKDTGIPSAKRRFSGYRYPPLSANFSMFYPLVVEEVLKNAPSGPGIYEFRSKGREIEYPNGKTHVIYIGSTKNINKRVREHLGKNSKNRRIKDFLGKFNCSFRYIHSQKNWKEAERKLYNLFVTTYGAPPKCNMVTPIVPKGVK